MWITPEIELPEGVRCVRAAESESESGRPALLLDRDGTLVAEVPYLHRVADVRLLPGAAALVAAANAAGAAVATVSNQSGIARGFYGWEAYEAVEDELRRCLAEAGGQLDARVACAFHPDHTVGWGAEHARWRKPGPAMLELAARELGFDPSRSWMVGDMASDAAAARAAGLAGCVHVSTGHGGSQRAAAIAEAAGGFAVLAAKDAVEARRLLRESGLFR